jgi:hypothetical protein
MIVQNIPWKNSLCSKPLRLHRQHPLWISQQVWRAIALLAKLSNCNKILSCPIGKLNSSSQHAVQGSFALSQEQKLQEPAQSSRCNFLGIFELANGTRQYFFALAIRQKNLVPHAEMTKEDSPSRVTNRVVYITSVCNFYLSGAAWVMENSPEVWNNKSGR